MAPPDDDPKRNPSGDRKASQALASTAALAALVVLIVSFAQGPPARLPDVALGWPTLLYLERAALLAFLIMGPGGLWYRMMRGDQVTEAGAAGQSMAVHDATKPTEALKEGVDQDIRALSERITDVERKAAKIDSDET